MQWHSRRTVKQRNRREETESGGEIGLDETQFVCYLLHYLFSFFSIFLGYRWTFLTDRQLWTSSINLKSVDLRPHFVKCHANKSHEESARFEWLTSTNTCLPKVHKSDRVYLQENIGETVGENRGKFYLSPTVCQRQCLPTVFMPFTHTNLGLPTRVCQL